MKRNTEVRIGNLVNYNEKPNRILKISRTHFNLINDEKRKFVYLKDAEGIELTSEWLENMGFEETIPENHTFTVYRYSEWLSGGWLDIHLDKGKGAFLNGVLIAECNYVHQLQNLFYALEGKELNTPQIQTLKKLVKEAINA